MMVVKDGSVKLLHVQAANCEEAGVIKQLPTAGISQLTKADRAYRPAGQCQLGKRIDRQANTSRKSSSQIPKQNLVRRASAIVISSSGLNGPS